jgi:[ribosomal protein S5]-alanine N-acetyltransferase
MTIAVNENCKLRHLEKSDLEILTRYANNPKIAINLRDGFPYPYTLEDASSFFNMVISQKLVSNFVIEYQGKFAGMIGLMPLNDVYCKSAEIGYWLGEAFWNKGIVTMAVKMIVDWAWKNLDIVRIHTGVFSYNPSSAKVLEKAGFTFECEFKNSIFKKGTIANELRYSILRPE